MMYDKGNYFECKHDRMKIFAQGSNKELLESVQNNMLFPILSSSLTFL